MVKKTVFYAWQSDCDQNGNRYLIQDALKRAIKTVNADLPAQSQLVLDHDTVGVAGTPEITATILRKIDDCAVFVADVSFVGESWEHVEADHRKLLPNPNVMIELGYAMSRKDEQQIILVMNEAYGTPADLPFDFSHKRWPLRYSYKEGEGTKRSAALSALSQKLVSALKAVVNSGKLASQNDATIEQARARVAETFEEFHSRLKAGKFCGMRVDNGCLAIAVLPENQVSGNLEVGTLTASLGRLADPIGNVACSSETGGRYLRRISVEVSSDVPPRAATEVDDHGRAYAASTYHLYVDPSPSGGVHAVHITAVEKVILATVARFLTLQGHTSKGGPCYVAFAFLNLQPCNFMSGMRFFSSDRLVEGDVAPDPLRIENPHLLTSIDELSAVMRPQIDFVWREFGHPHGSINYNRENVWDGGE